MKTYVITGAKSGIGLEITKRLLAAQNTVIAGVRTKGSAPSKELEALVGSSGGRLKIHDLDVQNEASVAAFATALKGQTIDALINNAGVYSKEDGAVSEVAPKEVQWTLETNFFGVLRLTQAMLPLLKKSKTPVIANISSKMGSIADNTSGGALAYRVSKAAVNMFTKNLAVDEPDVTAITLHPGWVKTRMGGDQAPLSPEKSAEGLVKTIEGATKAKSGKFFNYDGAELPW